LFRSSQSKPSAQEQAQVKASRQQFCVAWRDFLFLGAWPGAFRLPQGRARSCVPGASRANQDPRIPSSHHFRLVNQSEDVRTQNAKLFCNCASAVSLSPEPRYILRGTSTVKGRPNLMPRAFARAIPALTRSQMYGLKRASVRILARPSFALHLTATPLEFPEGGSQAVFPPGSC
jgi:hypothetical protein